MATSMVLIKQFRYRGNMDEEWSNRYHLTGDDPADNAAWLALFTALAAEEKKLYKSNVEIVRAYGYTNDSPTAHAVWSKDLVAEGAPILGTYAGTEVVAPGDAAGMIRWKTSRLTSKGKPIYLRKFFHGPTMSGTLSDYLATPHKTAYNAFATLLGGGAGIAGRNIRGPGQATEVILQSLASDVITTRTLKRRGARPTPAP